ncbi:hypothetical protein BGZ98_005543 [Dissophora globulifera]|nr:hypothetical protein BGZ98_005543 [Dissophora globulifera]
MGTRAGHNSTVIDTSNAMGLANAPSGHRAGKDPSKQREPRGPYRRYHPRQIGHMLELKVMKQLSVAEAARRSGKTVSTATRYAKNLTANPDGFHDLKRRGPCLVLGPQHTTFIIQYLDNNPLATMEQLQDELQDHFDIKVSKSTVQKHVHQECHHTFKRIREVSDMRNNPMVMAERKSWAEYWIQNQREYIYHSVFVDEAGFNLAMVPALAWSRKGNRANVTVPTQQGDNITVIGAISVFGVMSLTTKVPMAKIGPLPTAPVDVPGGTKAIHYKDSLIKLWIRWISIRG